MITRKMTLALAPAAMVLLYASTSVMANPLTKHPVLTGVAAAAIAHHEAKKHGAMRMAHGRKPNFAERHPMLTGVAAGMAAHHLAKKHG